MLGIVGYTQLLGLGEMIQSQKVTYDFKFHQTDLAVDLPILVLSQGRSIFVRNLFKTLKLAFIKSKI